MSHITIGKQTIQSYLFLTDQYFYTDIPVSFETRKILFYNAMDLFHEKLPVAHPVSHRKTPLAMTHTFV